MEPYITFNTNQRTKSKTEFQKAIWKLMNNSFYGKTIENVRNRINFNLYEKEEDVRREINKPEFTSIVKFTDNCIGIKKKVVLI